MGGADTLLGGAGNDLMIGGAGADTFDGGTGVDTVSFISSASAITINLASGMGFGGDAQGDSFANVENAIGSEYDDVLTGNASINELSGGLGDDALEGGAGADALDGGAGTDTASYAGSVSAVDVNLSTGVGAGGDAAGDMLTNIENLLGSSGDDTLTGDANANSLTGGSEIGRAHV